MTVGKIYRLNQTLLTHIVTENWPISSELNEGDIVLLLKSYDFYQENISLEFLHEGAIHHKTLQKNSIEKVFAEL